jgi:hypothetical protein
MKDRMAPLLYSCFSDKFIFVIILSLLTSVPLAKYDPAISTTAVVTEISIFWDITQSADVSEEHIASIFLSEDGGDVFFGNVG